MAIAIYNHTCATCCNTKLEPTFVHVIPYVGKTSGNQEEDQAEDDNL